MKKIILLIFFFSFISVKGEVITNNKVYEEKIENLTQENLKLKEFIEKYNNMLLNLKTNIQDLNNKIKDQNSSISYLSKLNNNNLIIYKDEINKLQTLLKNKNQENKDLNNNLSICLDKDDVIYKKDNSKIIYSFIIVGLVILLIIKKM